ncbi:MAG: FAD-dependent oxidoreductase [Myxococcota bacterium]
MIDDAADFVVVGSGAGGATAAYWLARAGHEVVVLEEGPLPRPAAGDAREALATLYRDGGAMAAIGADPLPLLQGRCVGGTTVVNGGIQVALPRAAWERWVARDPAWATRLPWDALEGARERIDALLGVAPTPPALHGGNGGRMLGAVAGAHPTRRNTPGCVGAGRCLQGCPHGRKRSVDVALLPEVIARGGRVHPGARVERVRTGLVEGRGLRVRARRAVVLAAGAVHTPWLLLRSGIAAGRGWMCHPGAAMAGRFDTPAFGMAEATQAAESLADLGEGLKYESLGMPRAFRAARVPGVGRALADRLERLDHVALWGVACRAEAVGRVRRGPFGPLVFYSLGRGDRERLLRGLSRLAVGMLRAGAREVWPAVKGAPEVVRTEAEARALADLPPVAGAVPLVATHFFGGASVGERFEAAPGVVVADASLLPANVGVNPMSAIMAAATIVAERWA